jgi:hypothetical protein
MNLPRRTPAPEPSELPRGFGVRWLAGNRADTALDGLRKAEAKAVCALTPHPPHSITLAHGPALALVQGRRAQNPSGSFLPALTQSSGSSLNMRNTRIAGSCMKPYAALIMLPWLSMTLGIHRW